MVTRTVTQTVNGVVATYKQDIEKAAGDNLLSRSEQATLTMISEIAGIDEVFLEPLSDHYDLTEGPAAITAFSDVIRQAGQDEVDNATDPLEGADLKSRLDALADASDAYFKSAGFQRVVFGRHTIAEDGDVEYNILLGQTPDGSWKTLTHSDFQF